MRVFFAVAMGLGILAVGLAIFRNLVGGRPAGPPPLEVVEQPPPGVRVLFYCENCHTEVLLLRKGSDAAPRHCGEPMIKREEAARG